MSRTPASAAGIGSILHAMSRSRESERTSNRGLEATRWKSSIRPTPSAGNLGIGSPVAVTLLSTASRAQGGALVPRTPRLVAARPRSARAQQLLHPRIGLEARERGLVRH